MAIEIKIEGVDRSSLIDWRTFQLEKVLTHQIDTVSFMIRKHGGQTYKPNLLDDVEILDNGSKIFGGSVVEVEDSVEGLLQKIRITAKDHTHEMDRFLVVDVFENTTVDAIIQDIVDNVLPAGFTTNGVEVTNDVEFAAFSYEQPSKVLQQLAELTGADWYVDENKDIKFFLKNTQTAPFNLTDTGENYFFNSLRIKQDVKNLRNTIYVRGGEFKGDLFTEDQEADGDAKVFVQGFRYSNITVKVDAVAQTVGIDNLDEPADFDCLYNFQEKAIKFRDDNKPTAGQVLEVTGNPHIPVIIKTKENVSIGQFGEFEHKIIDKSIDSKEGARQRAKAEIIAWAEEVSEGEFRTKKSGLRVGDNINVQSDIRGIDEDFIINRITTRLQTPDTFIYDVSLVTQRTFGMIEFLQQQLIQKDKEIEITRDEVLDKIESAIETIKLSESKTVSTVHNPQSESVTFNEGVTVRPLDYAVEFVLAPFPVPTGTKREFTLGSSTLS